MSDVLAKLQIAANSADHVRDLMKHQGMIILRAKIEEEIGKAHKRWLTAEPTEAEKIREATKGYEQFFSLVKKVLLEGDLAKQKIAEQAISTTSPSA